MGYGVMILFITLDRASCFYGFVQAARVFLFPSETGICLQPEMTGFYIPLHGAGIGILYSLHLSQACKSPNPFP